MNVINYKQRLLELNTPQVSDASRNIKRMDPSIRAYEGISLSRLVK